MSLPEVFRAALNGHFSGAPRGSFTPRELLLAREQFLPRIHYSWYSHALAALPPSEQALLKTSLPEEVKEKLGYQKGTLPPLFGKQLAKTMGLYNIPPLLLLPKGPFSSLLEMDKETLADLIALLPFPLLTPQIKKVVDKKRLLGIYAILTESQKEILKVMLIRPDQGTLSGLDLATWKGTSSDLEIELHKKGIQLLSQATKGEGEPFRFYLSRILDRGRGELYYKSSEENIAKDSIGLLHAVIKYINQRKSHDTVAKT